MKPVPAPDSGPPAPLRLLPLSLAAMQALERGDLDAASTEAGTPLTPWFASDDCRWLWRVRIDQMLRDPDSAGWLARVAVTGDRTPVGHAGFHGPPDESGMVEVGYTVDPTHRRRGYAREMLRLLLARAAEEPAVRTVRASISPDNVASMGTMRGFGFRRVGEQWDDEDGLEVLFEATVPGLTD